MSEKDRLNRITTGTGDRGTTRLADGTERSKAHAQIEAIGAVDELNAACGLLKAGLGPMPDLQRQIDAVQQRLFDIGGQLAMGRTVTVAPSALPDLESWSDALQEALPPLKSFVIPGSNELEARAQLCRTIARRAERRAVAMVEEQTAEQALDPICLAYLNRLSDYFFNLARTLGRLDSVAETQWQPTRKGEG